jgi:hypothetical protein
METVDVGVGKMEAELRQWGARLEAVSLTARSKTEILLLDLGARA